MYRSYFLFTDKLLEKIKINPLFQLSFPTVGSFVKYLPIMLYNSKLIFLKLFMSIEFVTSMYVST